MKSSFDMSFWTSDIDELLLNPRLPEEERSAFESAWERDCARASAQAGSRPARVAIATSGSAGKLKLVLLSKAAMLEAARAANTHLASTGDDVWLKALPDFHVGGLSIFARASLSGASVVDVTGSFAGGWSCARWVQEMTAAGATLSSLVPAQVFDLVMGAHRAPSSVRAVVVGGGRLPSELYQAARQLGWPLLPSYGLTECGSQVATAELFSVRNAAGIQAGFSAETSTVESVFPGLRPLPHVQVRISEAGFIELKSPSLLEGYLWIEGGASRFEDPKRNGWFSTEDRGRLTASGFIEILGRERDFIKIGGESVDLLKLEERLEEIKMNFREPLPDLALVAIPDERLGQVIQLVYEAIGGRAAGETKPLVVDQVIARFNERVAPFERIRTARRIDKIPRSSLGKLLRAELMRTEDTP